MNWANGTALKESTISPRALMQKRSQAAPGLMSLSLGGQGEGSNVEEKTQAPAVFSVIPSYYKWRVGSKANF